MVSSRLRTLVKYAVLLVALGGIVATSAFAGNLNPAPTTYANEIAKNAQDLTFAGQVYQMGIARNQGQNFILRYNLSSGTFGSASPTLAYGGAATVGISLRSGGALSSAVEFDVNVLSAGGTLASDTFTLTGTYRFPASTAVGTATTIAVDLRDVIGAIDTNNNLPTIGGAYTRNLAVMGASATFTATSDNATVIDATVNPPLTNFVIANDDTALAAVATVTTTKTVATTRDNTGTADYTLLAADQVTFTITGDFTGIASVVFDLNNDCPASPAAPTVGCMSNTGATTYATNETFTIGSGSATLRVNGDRLGNGSRIYFVKTAAAALNPRTFGISASIAAPNASLNPRTMSTANTSWFAWTQNGTTLLVPYVTFSQGNSGKFRFTNSTTTDLTVNVAITPDQSTAVLTQPITSFTVPALGSRQITLYDAPSAGTGEQGPIVTALGGTFTQPLRGKVIFTALTNTANIRGIVLIYSPVGVITFENMFQTPNP